jgi:hypothetical protein
MMRVQVASASAVVITAPATAPTETGAFVSYEIYYDLDRQIGDVYMMMRLSADKDELAHNFDKIFGPQLQLRLHVLKELPELAS